MKKYVIAISTLFISAIVIGIFLYNNNTPNNIDSYNDQAQAVIKELNISKIVKNQDYSQTVEEMLVSGNFKEDYIEFYYNINYIDREDFVTTLNILLEKNYDTTTINYIYTNLNSKNISYLTNNDYIELKQFLNITNLEVSNINRYFEYKDRFGYNLQTSVTYVNLNLDKDFYEEINTIENIESYQILINKFNRLPVGYIPSDLVEFKDYPNQLMRPEAHDNLLAMINAASLVGINIEPYSTYRSENTQNTLYKRYVEKDGIESADTYSARAGHSEHQAGLAADMRSVGEYSTLTDQALTWVLNNAHNYGYILRYLEETTFITGYVYEPWHLRYVGVKIATDMLNKNLTYDEYYDLYVKKVLD